MRKTFWQQANICPDKIKEADHLGLPLTLSSTILFFYDQIAKEPVSFLLNTQYTILSCGLT